MNSYWAQPEPMVARIPLMNRDPVWHDGPPNDLIDSDDWYISEYRNDKEDLALRGRFRMSPLHRLSEDQLSFLLTFLRCRGVISSVERELGISYPTVRSRLDALISALGLSATPESQFDQKREVSEAHKEILAKLEAGEITAEDAKRQMKEVAR